MKHEVPPYRRNRGIVAALARFPALLYKLGLGPLLGRKILLLTTTGRRSGRPRTTSLSYHRIDDTIYLLSEAGTHADWYRNVAKDPSVRVQVGGRRFQAVAERVSDPQLIARVLRLFNRAYPRATQYFHGIPARATDEELLTLAPQRLVIALRQEGR
jgi:deazaflavin-dependent oxidoreductase (nitroreductase family)